MCNHWFKNIQFKMTMTSSNCYTIMITNYDYAVLVNEDLADKCGEILDIIEAHLINNKR